MTASEAHTNFSEQMNRILCITGKRTQVELAGFLGVRQSSISFAKRRGKIPSSWLITLTRIKNVNPEWVLTGNGPCFLDIPPLERACYEAGICSGKNLSQEETLRRLPSRVLADELLRRIAVSENKDRGLG